MWLDDLFLNQHLLGLMKILIDSPLPQKFEVLDWCFKIVLVFNQLNFPFLA
jgi:hypothetical protein